MRRRRRWLASHSDAMLAARRRGGCTGRVRAVQNYVALGDSYSSGVGAGSYVGSGGSCERSTNAYSGGLGAGEYADRRYVSVACSGADDHGRDATGR